MPLGQIAIRYAGERAVQRPDAAGARTDCLHRAAAVAIADKIANPKRPVREDGEPAEKVLDRRLGGQRQGEAAYAETGDQSERRDADVVGTISDNRARREDGAEASRE